MTRMDVLLTVVAITFVVGLLFTGRALADSARFDETERAALALTHEMTTRVQVSEATMRRVRAVLPDDQVVELIGTIAGYNMVSRFVVATGLEME